MSTSYRAGQGGGHLGLRKLLEERQSWYCPDILLWLGWHLCTCIVMQVNLSVQFQLRATYKKASYNWFITTFGKGYKEEWTWCSIKWAEGEGAAWQLVKTKAYRTFPLLGYQSGAKAKELVAKMFVHVYSSHAIFFFPNFIQILHLLAQPLFLGYKVYAHYSY